MSLRKIQSICSNVTSGGTPSRANLNYWEGGTIPWLKTGDIKNNFIYEVDEYITNAGLENSSAKIIPINSLLIAMYGDGNTAGNVAINKIELATNQACCNLTIDPDIADYRYVYYYLKGSYTNLVNLKLGGSQQNLNSKTIKNFPIRLEPISIQRKIAAILTTYDDLIEVNKKRIIVYKNMIAELYKEWFVRFRLSEPQNLVFEKGVPEGFYIKKLPEIADITYGYPFDSARFNSEGSGRKIIRIRNILESKSVDFTDEIVDEKYIVKAGDLLIGMDGIFHLNRWYDEDSYLVQRTCRVKAKDSNLQAFLRLALEVPIHFYQSTIVGATVGHLGAKHLNEIEILMPSAQNFPLLERLSNIDEVILKLEITNRNLETQKENLLFRLMSGKLSVADLDIHYPPSMQTSEEAEEK